jgi:capsular exopolysaccharide synthesis family protein
VAKISEDSSSHPRKRATRLPAAQGNSPKTPPQPIKIPIPEKRIEADPDLVELDWSDEVDKIDEAIEEIRRINKPEQIKADLVEDISLTPAPEPEPQQEELLSMPAEEPYVRETTAAFTLKYKVRPKSESELGQLWGNIFFALEQAPPKIIIVMGAQRGEGATQIATGLAMVGAEADRELRVALVDFNVRNPQIADLLEIKHQPGLTDVLNGQATLDSAMQVVGLHNGNRLHVLTGGGVSNHPLGLLKSRQARSLIAQLRQRYDHVIIDVANAKTFPDPQVLGSLADGAVMVVKAADTPRETAAEAKKRLDLAGVRCLGLVLNKRSDPIPGLLYQFT